MATVGSIDLLSFDHRDGFYALDGCYQGRAFAWPRDNQELLGFANAFQSYLATSSPRICGHCPIRVLIFDRGLLDICLAVWADLF